MPVPRRITTRATVVFGVTGLMVMALWARAAPEAASSAGPAARPTSVSTLRPLLDLTKTPPGLAADDALRTVTGRSFFADPWVEAGATTTLRDGLGPLFNARSCTGCHLGGGRSSPVPERTGAWQITSGLLAGLGPATGRPDPRYGEQLQTRSTNGARRRTGAPSNARAGQGVGEGELQVLYRALHQRHADGQPYTLHQPAYRVVGLADGPLQQPASVSARIAPSLDNSALIEQVADATVLALADPGDRDRDGVSGRVNRVLANGPGSQRTALGRYGHKAAQPGLRQQTAAALHHDIGITSSVYPLEDCAERQAACRRARSGAGPSSPFEIDDVVLDDMVNFMRHLSVPERSAHAAQHPDLQRIKRGRQAFASARCAACHADGTAHQGLYSDLLLHDMGAGLADGRSEHSASGREWRTAPLAGLRLRSRLARIESYLHDGRARSLEEAVMWHDGEARAARQAFSRMSSVDRSALLAFLSTL
jgi:CxxC motif-containing protein (DUF1111 family)